MRFTKVKFDGAKVRIEYEVVRPQGDPDEYTLLCAEPPRKEFDEALQRLRSDVAEICEFAPEQSDRLKVRGVTFTWSNDVMGACITPMKTLKKANAPLVVNTPHLPEEAYAEGDRQAPTLPAAAILHLRQVLDEAERYVQGDRAQAQLFPVAGADEPAAASAVAH